MTLVDPNKYPIRHDFHAIRDSGQRDLHAIELFVIHDIESTNETGAAEGAGSWFENRAVQASSNYGIDNNSIQAYFPRPLTTIPWGAPGANTNGIHYELMGKAAWSREQWLEHAKPTLDRCAWLLARHWARLRADGIQIPLRKLTDSEVRAHRHGITTHRQLTRALGIGTHTDPGPDFPMDWLVGRARHYAGLTK